jgi:hypothetical protein
MDRSSLNHGKENGASVGRMGIRNERALSPSIASVAPWQIGEMIVPEMPGILEFSCQAERPNKFIRSDAAQ